MLMLQNSLVGITIRLDDKSNLSFHSFHELANKSYPGLKAGVDLVYNQSDAHYVTGNGPAASLAVAHIAKSYNLEVSRLVLEMQANPDPGLLDRYDPTWFAQSIEYAEKWFRKNKPRSSWNHDPKAIPQLWEVGTRTSVAYLRITADFRYVWYVRKETAKAAWAFIQLDRNGELDGFARAFNAITATLASNKVFGFELPGDDRLQLRKKDEVPTEKDFDAWLYGLVAKKIAAHVIARGYPSDSPNLFDSTLTLLKSHVHTEIMASLEDKSTIDKRSKG